MEQDEVYSAFITFLEAPRKETPEAQDAIDVLVSAAREGLLKRALEDIVRA